MLAKDLAQLLNGQLSCLDESTELQTACCDSRQIQQGDQQVYVSSAAFRFEVPGRDC